MRRLQTLTLALIFCFIAVAPMTRVAAVKHKPDNTAYAPGEIIVKLKRNAPELQIAAVRERETAITLMAEGESTARAVEPMIQAGVNKRTQRLISERGLDRTFVLKLDPDTDIEPAIRELRSRDDVEYAVPNYRITLGSVIPNDARFLDQWALKNFGYSVDALPSTIDADIKASEAWDITKGSPDVIVAVTDTGVDINHPDLQQNIYTNPLEIPGNKIDDDNNGYVDDVHGFNLADMNGDVTDIVGHGTQVSGIIAAQMDNNLGIAGTSQAKILPVRFFKKTGAGPAEYDATVSDAARALIYSVAAGASIINASWRSLFAADSVGEDERLALEDAVNVTNDAGVLLVSIAGNEGFNNDFTKVYPGAFGLPNQIVVAASDFNDHIWTSPFPPYQTLSGFGQKSVEIAAPGVAIITTAAHGNCALCIQDADPNNWYAKNDGTSFAAAFVSGVAALVKSKYPDDNAMYLKRRITDGADSREDLLAYVKSGARLNAFGALTVQVQITITPPVLTKAKVKGGGAKLNLFGTGIQPGARVVIGDKFYSPKPKNDELTQLLAKVPKTSFPRGVPVPVKLRNPDGGTSETIIITR